MMTSDDYGIEMENHFQSSRSSLTSYKRSSVIKAAPNPVPDSLKNINRQSTLQVLKEAAQRSQVISIERVERTWYKFWSQYRDNEEIYDSDSSTGSLDSTESADQLGDDAQLKSTRLKAIPLEKKIRECEGIRRNKASIRKKG